MAAAYAALTSLKHTINNLHNHPFPPIPTDKQQVRSLTEVLTFLQEFLRGYNSRFAYSDEADPLEARIQDVAFNAEDVIESKIVDQLRSQSTNPGKCTGDDLYQHLQLVIEEMDLIKKETMTIQTAKTPVRPQMRRDVSKADGSSTSSSSMVGFDDVFLEVLDSLIGSHLDLQIIPITGMGGIGKTTFARNLFENACVKEHFDVRAWTTISQVYNAQQALKELLSQAKGQSSGESESELGLELYQQLWGRRYLIVMDDMWSLEVWDKIRSFFPNNKDGSRIIVTTRLSNLASYFNNCFNMPFLDDVDSWNLFSKTVFGEESFSLDLEDLGKSIARKCRGLPLSIVIVGGLLAKSEQTREYWEHIEENLNSMVNSEDDDYCLRILKMSYNHLPIHLKPCFLYMGVFEEDRSIFASILINKWISEGFIEPTSDKSLETIAKENLKELVDRNLVLVDVLNYRQCKIHDLLRDLCIREAKKCGFYVYAGEHIPQDINSMCRVVVPIHTLDDKFLEASKSMPNAISILFDYNVEEEATGPFKLRLLRTIIASSEDKLWHIVGILSSEEKFLYRNLFEIANLRCLTLRYINFHNISFNLFWNLHILIIDGLGRVTLPIEIWNMPHLRQVRSFCGVYLPDPPTYQDVILKNLRKLKQVINLKLSQDVVKRIPNIKTLEVIYDEIEPHEDYYCLNYLECLQKLESFGCFIRDVEVQDFVKKLTFPQSLKSLVIDVNKDFELEEILEKIGALPLLWYLQVSGGFFRTGEWRTIESHFCRLESLRLQMCGGLKQLTLERSHFPRLEEVHLRLEELEEISSEIGYIPTLQLIDVRGCKMSAAMCLKNIVEEQEEEQGEEQLSFKVKVVLQKSEVRWEEVLCSESTGRCGQREPHFHSFLVKDDTETLKRLRSPNFHIRI